MLSLFNSIQNYSFLHPLLCFALTQPMFTLLRVLNRTVFTYSTLSPTNLKEWMKNKDEHTFKVCFKRWYYILLFLEKSHTEGDQSVRKQQRR